MERRSFLKLSSALALTVSYKASGMAVPFGEEDVIKPENIIAPAFKIHPDGTFDILVGSLILRHCLPLIDEDRITPLKVDIAREENTTVVRYTVTSGAVIMRFAVADSVLSITATLEGMPVAPHFFYPISTTNVDGADRFYQQGLGFGGPSGIRSLATSDAPTSFDSYMLSALLSADDNIMVLSADNYHKYIHRSQAYTRVFRTDLTHRTTDARLIGFDAGFATEHKPIVGRLEMPGIMITGAKIPFRGMRRHARLLADRNNINLPFTSRYHYCSWYEFEKEFSRTRLDDVLDGFGSIKPSVNVQTIQIDDGYCTHGDWLIPNEKWPGGLQSAFQAIRDKGYEAGIWVAPFMVQRSSQLYKQHPDWVIRNENGQPHVEWDRPEDQWYFLDGSHPEAFAYLRTVFRTLKSWGASYFKIDFLDWGLKDSVRFHKAVEGYTSMETFRNVLGMIREEIGEESFLLACIAPFQAVFGLANGVRIANDVSPNWGSALNMFNESFAGQYFNNIWWQSDNDVVYLRDERNELSQTERETLALWNAFLGGIVNTSDRLHTISKENLRLWRFIEPREQKSLVYVHHWDKPGGLKVARRWFKEQKSFALLIINDTPDEQSAVIGLEELVKLKRPAVFSWSNFEHQPLGTMSDVQLTLPAHSYKLLYLNNINTPPPPNMTLAGKMVDL